MFSTKLKRKIALTKMDDLTSLVDKNDTLHFTNTIFLINAVFK